MKEKGSVKRKKRERRRMDAKKKERKWREVENRKKEKEQGSGGKGGGVQVCRQRRVKRTVSANERDREEQGPPHPGCTRRSRHPPLEGSMYVTISWTS